VPRGGDLAGIPEQLRAFLADVLGYINVGIFWGWLSLGMYGMYFVSIRLACVRPYTSARKAPTNQMAAAMRRAIREPPSTRQQR
jgi:hypothetical protein